MGTPRASGRGDPERACVQGPVRVCMETERAWGPGASVHAWPGACVHAWGPRVRAGMGTWSEHARRAWCVRAWKPSGRGGPVRVCVRGDPTSERAWGPGACVHRDQAGVGTRCERARWALRASRRGDLVRASVHGPGACVRGPSACVDPAGTDTGMQGSGKDGVVVNPRASKHSACKKITKFTYL